MPVQHGACSAVGLHTQWTRYGRPFRRLLVEANERDSWSQDRIVAFRDARLRAFVAHAAKTTPYYRRSFADLGIAPEEIRSLDDLALLPILTKEEAQEQVAALTSTTVPRRAARTIHTSGTTGGGLRFSATYQSLREHRAMWWRFRGWHGIDLHAWCAFFMGRSVVPVAQREPPFWRYNFPGRQIHFSAYHMGPATLDAYVGELRRRRPPWLHGFSSLLSLLAHHVVDNDIDLGYPIRWVTVAAENLLPQQAAVIEQAFGVRPRQHYGMAEAVAHISECDAGRLHVDEDFAAVEFVPVGDNRFRIVGTTSPTPRRHSCATTSMTSSRSTATLGVTAGVRGGSCRRSTGGARTTWS